MTSRRERMPRKATTEGSRLDAPFDLGGDPTGNRAQRRAAARNKRRATGSEATRPTDDGRDAT